MSGILRSVRLHDSCGDYQVGDVEKAYLSSMSESCIVSFTIKYVYFFTTWLESFKFKL